MRSCMKFAGLTPDFGPLVRVFIHCTHVVLEIALPLSPDHFRVPISRICGLQDGRVFFGEIPDFRDSLS